jgi:membrane-bound ClpP family serine protease
MGFLAAYLIIGLSVSVWVIASRPRLDAKDVMRVPLDIHTGPYIGVFVFLLWPIWLAVILVNKGTDVIAAPQEYLTRELVGKNGDVVVVLQPRGRVRVEGKLYDATSPQGVLTAGTMVIVTGRKLGELTVERANAPKA